MIFVFHTGSTRAWPGHFAKGPTALAVLSDSEKVPQAVAQMAPVGGPTPFHETALLGAQASRLLRIDCLRQSAGEKPAAGLLRGSDPKGVTLHSPGQAKRSPGSSQARSPALKGPHTVRHGSVRLPKLGPPAVAQLGNGEARSRKGPTVLALLMVTTDLRSAADVAPGAALRLTARRLEGVR